MRVQHNINITLETTAVEKGFHLKAFLNAEANPAFDVIVDQDFTETEMKEMCFQWQELFRARLVSLESRMKNQLLYSFVDKMSPSFHTDLG